MTPAEQLVGHVTITFFWAVLNWKSKPRGVLQNKILGLEPGIFLGNSAVWGVYGGLDPRILFSGEALWSGSQQVLLLDGQEVGTLLILFFACVSRNNVDIFGIDCCHPKKRLVDSYCKHAAISYNIYNHGFAGQNCCYTIKPSQLTWTSP